MVRMGSYNLCDGIQELCHEIDHCHFTYLDMDESSEKIEQRNKLEEYIHEFLCIVDHRRKFIFPETNEVLVKSATSKKDFSGYKAAAGFIAIQMYAGNLIAQPWRKEYRQIKTYSGFYKHQIEANLVGAEIMFEALGYRNIGNGLLELDGPINVDRVVAVSRDCLIAYEECQILKIIWEDVSTLYKISWLDVLKFRIAHICSPEQSVNCLKHKHHQRQYQEHSRSYPQSSDPFGNTRCQPVPITNNLSPVLALNNSFPPLGSHHHVGLPQAQPEYLYTNGFCSNSYGTCGPNYSYIPYNQPIIKPPCNPNGYCYNAYIPPAPNSYQQIVPTGKLIEVESQNGSYDMVDGKSSHKSRNFESPSNDYYKTKNNSEIISNVIDTSSDKKDSQLEEWDYVYRDLESQGYSKDLGERGDVLSPNSNRRTKETRKMKATNLDEQLNNMVINDRPVKTTDTFIRKNTDRRKNDEIVVIDKEHSSASSYDNVFTDDTRVQNKPNTSNNVKTKTLMKEKHSNAIDIIPQNKDNTLSNKRSNSALSPVVTRKWQCKHCTFVNDSCKDICDICFKSKIVPSEPPMEIGGAECPTCTLVNPKKMKKCQACNGSLENSPTYI